MTTRRIKTEKYPNMFTDVEKEEQAGTSSTPAAFSAEPFSYDEAIANAATSIGGSEFAADTSTVDNLLVRGPAASKVRPTASSADAASTPSTVTPTEVQSVVAATASSSAGLGTTRGIDNILYPTNANGSPVISVSDINQGAIGDCYFLASLGEIAIQDPAAIARAISVNANGTETVTLYGDANGGTIGFDTTSFAPIRITVNNAGFSDGGVNASAGQAAWNGEQVIWPQVLENAFAQLSGGYAAIANGGTPVLALEILTGDAATWYAPSQVSASMLGREWAAGDLVVFDTPAYDNLFDEDLTYNLVGDHAYMFDGLSTVNGVACVDLLNPWGDDQADPVPVSALATAFVEIDVGECAPLVPPTLAGTAATVAITDRETTAPFAGVTVTSVAGQTETVTVTLSSARDGALYDAAGGICSASTGTWTATGTAAQVTTALDALVFAPTAHLVAPGSVETTTLSLAVVDVQGTATASTSVATTDLLDPIVLAGFPATASITDGSTATPYAGSSISDPDAGQSFVATVTIWDADDGTLSSVGGGAYDHATGTWTMDGSAAAVNAAVNALVFTPTAHQVAVGDAVTTSLVMKVVGTAGASATAVSTVTSTAAEDAPKLFGTASSLASDDTVPTAIFGSTNLVDPDAGAILTATVQASGLDGGTLSDALGGTFGTAGDWTVTGDVSTVASALNALVYTPDASQGVAGTLVATDFALSVVDGTGGSAAALTDLTVKDTAAATPQASLVSLAPDTQVLGWFGTSAVSTMVDDGTVSLAFGSMTVATVDPASDGTFVLGSDATLEVGSMTGRSASMTFLTPDDALIVDHASLFGTGVGTTSYAGPILSGFTAGDVIDLKDVGFSAALRSVYNAGTGILQISNGVSDIASLAFASAKLGAGTFRVASDNAHGILVTLG